MKKSAGSSTSTRERWIATRGVSWRVGDGWEHREAGDDVSDAPAEVLSALRDRGAVEPAGEAKEEAGNG